MLRIALATASLLLPLTTAVATEKKPVQQRDSTVVVSRAAGNPVGALWRSAVLPGWGQAYNRQWYKVPFVYGAIGGLAAAAISNNTWFERYNRAYLYAAFLSEEPHPYPGFADDYRPYEGVSASALKARRDRNLRNRDLSVIGAGLAYALTLLDAYVNGHLRDFDVSSDLSAAGVFGGPAFRISVSVSL